MANITKGSRKKIVRRLTIEEIAGKNRKDCLVSKKREKKGKNARRIESGDECSFLELSSFAGEQSERDTYIPK